MTVGSGRRLLPLFDKSSPLGRCSRILLGLETWGSVEFSLRWQGAATKCGCSVFRLVPSARRIDASDTGSSAAAWPTTASRDHKGVTQHPERPDYIPNILKATWPSPTAMDAIRGELPPRSHDTGVPLNQRLAQATWPTPRSAGSEATGPHRGVPDTLPSATKAAWATPRTAQGGQDEARRARPNSGGDDLVTQASEAIRGADTVGCLVQTTKFAVRLMILSAWLMGYPWSYLKHWRRKGEKRGLRKTASR